MDCRQVEERLSEYLEHQVPEKELEPIAEHLRRCAGCAALYEEMLSALAACRDFPALDPDPSLVDRILRSTSGQKPRKSFGEFWAALWHPGLLPRFAAGAVLAALFATLLTSVLSPSLTDPASALSPGEVFSRMNRRIQQLYGEGLKAYEQKSRWQAKFQFFKDNAFDKITFMMARFDLPAEGEI